MLIAHLAKEWREQRLLLAMCAAVLLVLPALAAWLLPDSGIARLPWFAIAVLVGAVVLGTELVGGEARRGQLDFLARLPGALRHAFVAKLCILFAGILLLAVCGYAAESLVALLTSPRPFAWPPFFQGLVLCGLVLGLWLLGTSCWWPATLTSMVGTLLVPGLLMCTPFLLAPISFYGIEPRPPVWERILYLLPIDYAQHWIVAYTALAGLALCVLGFRRVLARPGDRRPYGTWFAACTLAFAPLWWRVGTEQWRWHHVDPGAEDTRIVDAFVGPDHRLAFLNLEKDLHPWSNEPNGRVFYSVLVDLESGAWRQVAGPQSAWLCVDALDTGRRGVPCVGQVPFIIREQMTPDGTDVVDAMELVDPRTAEVRSMGSRFRFEALPDEVLEEHVRAMSPHRAADGTEFYVFRERFWAMAPDGARRELPWNPGDYHYHPLGHGFRVANERTGIKPPRYFDVGRRRFFETAVTFDPVAIRRGAWLCLDSTDLPRDTKRYVLYWPESRTLGPVQGLEQGDRIGLLLADETILVAHDEGRHSTIWRLDPETGVRTALRLEGGPDGIVEQVVGGRGFYYTIPARTPSGHEVVRLDLRDRGSCYARITGDRLVCTPEIDADWLEIVSCPDDDHALVVTDGRRLVRLGFGRAGTEVLFPR